MTFTVVLLLTISLATLVAGFFAWRMTSSRPLLLNILFSSAAILIAAGYAGSRHNLQMSFIMPFLAAMLIAGRGGAFFIRSRRAEPELRAPSLMLLGTAGFALIGAVAAFLHA